MIRDLEERKRLKQEYYQKWKESDCPKPWDYRNKREYKKAREEYIKDNSDITDYLEKRRQYFLDCGNFELASFYDIYNLPTPKHQQLDLEFSQIIS